MQLNCVTHLFVVQGRAFPPGQLLLLHGLSSGLYWTAGGRRGWGPRLSGPVAPAGDAAVGPQCSGCVARVRLTHRFWGLIFLPVHIAIPSSAIYSFERCDNSKGSRLPTEAGHSSVSSVVASSYLGGRLSFSFIFSGSYVI